MLHTDEAGWTDRAHSLNHDHFSFNSKVGCNYHPTSAWASVQAVSADGSMAMLTDRSRGVASLSDGSLEYILHRHATGGNGRGPSDGDPNSARGAVTLVLSASSTGFAAAVAGTPRLALMRAHPTAVLYSPTTAVGVEWDSAGGDFSPLTRSLPDEVHLFSLSRRAFQKLVSTCATRRFLRFPERFLQIDCVRRVATALTMLLAGGKARSSFRTWRMIHPPKWMSAHCSHEA